MTSSNTTISNVSTTKLRQWRFWQCLPFSQTTLRDKHCRHPIAIMGVVDTLGLGCIKKKCRCQKNENLRVCLRESRRDFLSILHRSQSQSQYNSEMENIFWQSYLFSFLSFDIIKTFLYDKYQFSVECIEEGTDDSKGQLNSE